jgi:hypothetical protein
MVEDEIGGGGQVDGGVVDPFLELVAKRNAKPLAADVRRGGGPFEFGLFRRGGGLTLQLAEAYALQRAGEAKPLRAAQYLRATADDPPERLLPFASALVARMARVKELSESNDLPPLIDALLARTSPYAPSAHATVTKASFILTPSPQHVRLVATQIDRGADAVISQLERILKIAPSPLVDVLKAHPPVAAAYAVASDAVARASVAVDGALLGR